MLCRQQDQRLSKGRLYCCAAAFLLLAGHAASAGKQVLQLKYESLVPGVDYAAYITKAPPVYVHVVRADLFQHGIRLGAVKADRKESVDQMAQRYTTPERKAIAVINADYFFFDREAEKGPWGVHVQNSEIMFTPLKKNSAFMVGPDGRPFIDIPRVQLAAQFGASLTWHEILSLNRQEFLDKQGLHLFSTMCEVGNLTIKEGLAIALNGGPIVLGKVTRFTVASIATPSTSVTIPSDEYVLNYHPKSQTGTTQIKPATEVHIKAQMIPAATDAVGGGPRILRSGKPSIEFGKEDFSPGFEAYLKGGRHPRSAAGYSRDRHYAFLVIVEGRIRRSQGMDMKELADFMVDVGASDAIAFDGGGSATLFTEKYQSQTSENEMRRVENGLAVFQMTENAN
jgi:hypothetical protein